MPTRLIWKLYAGYVGLILLIAAVIGIFVAADLADSTRREYAQQLSRTTVWLRQIATPFLERGSATGLEERLEELKAAAGTRFTVIDAEGHVYADSHRDVAEMENHLTRPEFQLALDAEARGELGVAKSQRESQTVGAELLYVARTVRSDDGKLLGFVRAALPTTITEGRASELVREVMLGAFLAAGLALLLGLVIARRVTAPLGDLTEAASEIAAGEYGRRVEWRSHDEIGQLAAAFNTMAEQLEERMEMVTRENAKLATVLEGMIEGVVAIDAEERVIHLNEVAADMLGTTVEQAVGQPIFESTRVQRVAEALVRCSEEGAEVHEELRLFEGNGGERRIELRAVPLRSDAQTAGAVAVLHDLTNLRRLAGIRQEFVTNVSHELQDPIGGIRSAIDQVLADESMAPDEQKRLLNRGIEQVERLSHLVADLLTVARLESEAATLEFTSFDLRRPIRDVTRAAEPTIAARGLHLELDLPEPPVPFDGDSEAMRQIVSNLLNNAIRHTPAGGHIRVRLWTDANTTTIEVQDTGYGIEEHHLARIFERFYRVDKKRSRDLGGTGLGLSIVKHLAEAHGGHITVESRVGHGSTFRAVFPG